VSGACGHRLGRLAARAGAHKHPTHREVVAPLALALAAMGCGRYSEAADSLREVDARRFGGSDAQREVLEEARIAALVRAGRLDEARLVLDRRIDRRHSPRDRDWRRGLGEGDGVAVDAERDLRERGARRPVHH